MNPRAQLSRPPLERMLRIHEELRCGTLTNCTKLVKLLEVSRKTVVRDIAFMRDRWTCRSNSTRRSRPIATRIR